MGGLHSIEQTVLKEWKSTKAIHSFLQEEFERINGICFDGQLALPRFQVKRIWLPRGIRGGERIVAHYVPASRGHQARISLYPHALLSEQNARAALAHELIHHWEATIVEDGSSISYPPVVNQIIAKRFPDQKTEQKWRKSHSIQFIAKVSKVSRALGLSFMELIFPD